MEAAQAYFEKFKCQHGGKPALLGYLRRLIFKAIICSEKARIEPVLIEQTQIDQNISIRAKDARLIDIDWKKGDIYTGYEGD